MEQQSSVAEPEENIFLMNIFCSQFGGCYDEENPPLRHISSGTIL